MLCYFVQKLCPRVRWLASRTWRRAASGRLFGKARPPYPDRDHASRGALTKRPDRRASTRNARARRQLEVKKRDLITDFEKIFRIFFRRDVRRA